MPLQFVAQGPMLIPTTGAFTGLGDVASVIAAGGFDNYWGLRAYSAAKAAALQPLIDIADTSNANPATITCLNTGHLDQATLAAWIVAHGTARITKIYDQVGSAPFLMSAIGTAPNMTTTALINSGYGIDGRGFTSTMTTSPTNIATGSFPYTISAVALTNGSGGGINKLLDISGGGTFGIGNAANTWRMQLNSAATFPDATNLSDTNFHSVNAAYINSAGTLWGDATNVSRTGDIGGATAASVAVLFGQTWTGFVAEIGFKASDLSSIFSDIQSNQHSTNGYSF